MKSTKSKWKSLEIWYVINVNASKRYNVVVNSEKKNNIVLIRQKMACSIECLLCRKLDMICSGFVYPFPEGGRDTSCGMVGSLPPAQRQLRGDRGQADRGELWWSDTPGGTPHTAQTSQSALLSVSFISISTFSFKKNVDPSHCTCISLLQVITPPYYYKCYFVHENVILTCYLSSPSLMGPHALLPSHNMDFLQ